MGHRESPWRRALPAEQTRHPEGSFEGHLAQDPVGRRTERSCNGGIPCQQPFEEAHGMTPIRNGGIPPCLELVEEANGMRRSGAALPVVEARPAKAAFPRPGGCLAAGRRLPQGRGRWSWERSPDRDLVKGRRRAPPGWRHPEGAFAKGRTRGDLMSPQMPGRRMRFFRRSPPRGALRMTGRMGWKIPDAA